MMTTPTSLKGCTHWLIDVVGNYFWTMTDTQFDHELKGYLSDILVADKEVIAIEFYLNIQPGMISFGGHFVTAPSESLIEDWENPLAKLQLLATSPYIG